MSLRLPARTTQYLVFSIIIFSLTVRAPAGGVVTVPSESNLRSALAGGGTVTFAVDGRILLSRTIVIANDTVLDGRGHWVIISGNNPVRLFKVLTNVSCSMSGLTLADGHYVGGSTATQYDACGGAILCQGGSLNLSDCIFTRHHVEGAKLPTYSPVAPGRASGGAICSLGGKVSLTNCLLSGNEARGGFVVALSAISN